MGLDPWAFKILPTNRQHKESRWDTVSFLIQTTLSTWLLDKVAGELYGTENSGAERGNGAILTRWFIII